MMPIDQARARLADGAPVSCWAARRAEPHASRPLTRTSYGLSAPEFNATLPEVAHEAARARDIEAVTESPVDMSLDTCSALAGVAQGLCERKLVTKVGNDQLGHWNVWRKFKPTAAGRRLLARVSEYFARGGAAPLRPTAEVLREHTATHPALAMPTPRPFTVSKWARWQDVLKEAERSSEQHEKELLGRCGFHRCNSSLRLSGITRRFPRPSLRRDLRDAALLGLLRHEQRGDHDLWFLTEQGERQAAEIPAPARKARAA